LPPISRKEAVENSDTKKETVNHDSYVDEVHKRNQDYYANLDRKMNAV
jgi:hypothetical protein